MGCTISDKSMMYSCCSGAGFEGGIPQLEADHLLRVSFHVRFAH